MTYKIKKGDTLNKIANANGLTLDQIKKINPNIKDVNKIYVGQKINIKSNNSEDNSKDNSNNLSTIGVNNPVVNRSELVKASLNRNAKNLQKQLKGLGYDLGTTGPNKDGVDGDWGDKSQAALDDALSKGYKYLNGKLVDPSEQQSPQQSSQQSRFNTYVVWTPTLNAGDECGTQGCARYANETLRNHKDSKGRELYSWDTTGGDAWTRLSKGSAKMIYSGYDDEEYDRNAYSDKASDKRNFAAADRLYREFDSKTLDPNKTYMVNMYYKGSSARKEAWENGMDGITGTHTGNLYFDKNTGRWRVSHNIHNKLYDDDFIKIQGSKGQYGVTAIAEAVPLDHSEEDRRDDYRERKPIRGWIRDQIGWWKKGGTLIPKAQTGVKIDPELGYVSDPVQITAIGEKRFTGDAKKYVRAINNFRNQYMQKYNMSDQEYADLSKSAVNLAQQESNMGNSERYIAKNSVRRYFPTVFKGAKFMKNTLDWINGDDFKSMNPSLGMTQIKYDDDISNPQLKKMYDDTGVNKINIDFDPEMQAAATLTRLMYNRQQMNPQYHWSDGTLMDQDTADALYWNYGKLTDGLNTNPNDPSAQGASLRARRFQNNRIIK